MLPLIFPDRGEENPCRIESTELVVGIASQNEADSIQHPTAAADLVMSYASMAANTLLNLLKPDELLMLAEGLDIFRIRVPPTLLGKSLAESQTRKQTGCNIIAVYDQKKMRFNPGSCLPF
jgi:Trk K+ transport system NAD-binding subunit